MTPDHVVPRRTFGAALAGAAVGLATLSACRGTGGTGAATVDAAARTLATDLAKGVTSGDLSGVDLDDRVRATADLTTIMSGMDGLRPTTTVTSLTADGDAVTVTLAHALTLGSGTWRYSSTAHLVRDSGLWKVRWDPAIVHPDLTASTRLRHTRTPGSRAAITGAKGRELVYQQTIHDIGIDKSHLARNQWASAAATLAKLVAIDPTQYAAKVQAAGAQAFVVAITLREQDIPRNLGQVPGIGIVDRQGWLAPTRTFAIGILGTSGQAQEADVTAGKGEIAEGDVVGRSGLQRRYDAQLRGKAGHSIHLVARTSSTASASAGPTSSSGPTGSTTAVPRQLFDVRKVDGTPLRTTLDLSWQTKAESVLGKASGVACLVAVDPATGGILAAANSSAAGAESFATTGQYAPGSTFKVATTLALLRAGMTVDSTVACTPTVTVNGRSFKNYADYSSSHEGSIPLSEAFAQSCNTAFISQHAKVTAASLRQAASSLGVGTDHDAGFPAYYGTIDDTTAADVLASDMIGQGGVLASPMAMAGVAASVAAGRTLIPWLIEGHRPTSTARALSTTEVANLRRAMELTVTSGSGRVLAGLATGAKTGTAEFGAAGKLKTHAWMIAYTSTMAAAVMVEVGESGSGTAGPLLKAFWS